MRWFRRRLGRDASVEEPPQERTDPDLAAEEFWRGWYELLPRISAALGEREPHRIEYQLTELVARIHPDLQCSVDRGERAAYSLSITGQEEPALPPATQARSAAAP